MSKVNKVHVERTIGDKKLTVRGQYNPKTDDWNLVLFSAGKIIDTRATTDIWAEIADMLQANRRAA